MLTVEESIDVRAPIAAVFSAATDPRRASEWNPHVVAVKGLSEHPVRQGTTWEQTASVAGSTVTVSCRVVRFAPPHEGVLEISGEQRGRIVTQCREANGSTRVTQSMEIVMPGGLKGAMMTKIAQPMVRKELVQSLKRMRDALEREAGASGASRPA